MSVLFHDVLPSRLHVCSVVRANAKDLAGSHLIELVGQNLDDELFVVRNIGKAGTNKHCFRLAHAEIDDRVVPRVGPPVCGKREARFCHFFESSLQKSFQYEHAHRNMCKIIARFVTLRAALSVNAA